MRLIDADEIRIKPEYMHDICGSAMIRVEDVARIINEMPTIDPQPRWTPCSERLPEDDVYVLISKKPSPISGKEFSVTIGMRYINRRSKKAEWRDSGFGYLSDDKVLAWMPLPSPYQEEGEEDA